MSERPRELEDIENLYCGSVYPGPQFFEGCSTALCIFCAEWFGMQDAYWIAKAGLVGTCVDQNAEKLEMMRELYPKGWEFEATDAYEFAEQALADGRQWDALTLDPWTGQFQRCADLLGTWTSLARRVVVLGHGNYRLHRPEAPEGWSMVQEFKRSTFKGGIFWLVYARD